MFCNYANTKRSIQWILLLTTAVLYFCLAGLTPASAATICSPKPNTLFVSASVPSGFNNTLCITLNEASTGKTLTLKFDCTSNLSVNAQLDNGSYEVLGAYAERHRDCYEVICDNVKFTIGDDSSPVLTMVVQSRSEQSLTGTTTSSHVSPDVSPSESAEEPDTEASEELRIAEEGEAPDLDAEPSEALSEEETFSADEEDASKDESSSGGALKLLFQVILSLFATVFFFVTVSLIVCFVRQRRD